MIWEIEIIKDPDFLASLTGPVLGTVLEIHIEDYWVIDYVFKTDHEPHGYCLFGHPSALVETVQRHYKERGCDHVLVELLL